MKLRLFIIITLFLVAANAGFADTYNYEPSIVTLSRTNNTLDVSVNTAAITGSGYIYFQYSQSGTAAPSTATIQNFPATALGSRDTSGETNGVSGTGPLPADVVFDSTQGGLWSLEDYNHAITFGSIIDFSVLFNGGIGPIGGSSTFYMGLYGEAEGGSPLITNDGVLFTEDFVNTPEPSTLLLVGPALLGVIGLRKRFSK
jgi:hypothetical protein